MKVIQFNPFLHQKFKEEKLDVYERIHENTETMVDKKQNWIMALDHLPYVKNIETPDDTKGEDKLLIHQNPFYD